MSTPIVTPLKPNAQDISDFWRVLVRPGEVHEIRIRDAQRGPARLFGTVSGYFNNVDAVVRAVTPITGRDAPCVYVTLNPVNPNFLARSCNQLKNKVDATSSDSDVVWRRTLLIETDPVRPTGISATDEEVRLAVERRDALWAFLSQERGWRDPLAVTQSPNGGALLYRVDLPNDDDARDLVQGVLGALAARFSDDRVEVDASVFNAARLTKLVGTVGAKGENMVGQPGLRDRPHRLATATYPAHPDIIGLEQMQAVAADGAPAHPGADAGQHHKGQDAGAGGNANQGRRAWLDRVLKLNELQGEWRPYKGGSRLVLSRCLTSNDHTHGAALFLREDGTIGYGCKHNRCAGKTWAYLLEHHLVKLPDEGNGTASPNGRMAPSAAGQGMEEEPQRSASGTGDDRRNGHTQSGPAPVDWDDPVPLRCFVRPPFPDRALPGWLREYCAALSEAKQTPFDVAAWQSLAAIATTVARRFIVRVKTDYFEPVNVYAANILPPGERKTPVVAETTEPLTAWEREQARTWGPEVKAKQTKRNILVAALANAEREAAREMDDAKRQVLVAKAEGLARELAKTPEPVVPRLLADDCTSEKFASLLAAQGGRMSVLSDEGTIFEIMGGRYSQNPNIEVFLKGHSVLMPLIVDRGGREHEYVPMPTITIGVSVQPDVVKGFAAHPSFRGRGLIGRFIYSYPQSRLGTRRSAAVPFPAALRTDYAERLGRLLQIKPQEQPGAEPAPHTLVLSAEARARWEQFHDALEEEVGFEGELGSMSDWACKLCGTMVRIAGLLHLAEQATTGRPWGVTIEAEVMDRAAMIAIYCIEHARAALGLMGADSAGDDARTLLTWLERGARKDPHVFTRTEALRATRGTIARAEDLSAALATLEEHSYIRREAQATPAKGKPEASKRDVGRPPQRYWVHPKLAEKHEQGRPSTGDSEPTRQPFAALRALFAEQCEGLI